MLHTEKEILVENKQTRPSTMITQLWNNGTHVTPECHSVVWYAEAPHEPAPHNACRAPPGAESDAWPAAQTTLPAQTTQASDPTPDISVTQRTAIKNSTVVSSQQWNHL